MARDRQGSRERSVFFFSSRRRHTRFDCDWSSDVCSSDLGPAYRNCWTSSFHRLHVHDEVLGFSEAARRDAHVLLVRERDPFSHRLVRSEEHTSELQSQSNLVCRLLLEKKKNMSELDTHHYRCSV